MTSPSARGAILIQVVLAMGAIGGFCALAFDYGILMIARTQVQSAADAGAIAAATALAFDDAFADTSIVIESARNAGQANEVWQSPPDITAGDVQLMNYCAVSGLPTPPQGGRPLLTCARVSAFRNQARNNPLPTFFGHLLGLETQGVRAQATAVAVPGNTLDCVWPVALPDLWQDNNDPALVPPTFTVYTAAGPPNLLALPDAYEVPNVWGTGTSYSLAPSAYLSVDSSLNTITLQQANFTTPSSPGRYVAVQIPRVDGGGFGSNLNSCNGAPMFLGDTLGYESSATASQVANNAAARIAADPGASWNPTSFRVENSCAGSNPPCAPISPRVVALPLFDLNTYEQTRWNGSTQGATPTIVVSNYVGLFITQVVGTTITGKLTLFPARVQTNKSMIGYRSAFLRATLLIR